MIRDESVYFWELFLGNWGHDEWLRASWNYRVKYHYYWKPNVFLCIAINLSFGCKSDVVNKYRSDVDNPKWRTLKTPHSST